MRYRQVSISEDSAICRGKLPLRYFGALMRPLLMAVSIHGFTYNEVVTARFFDYDYAHEHENNGKEVGKNRKSLYSGRRERGPAV